MKTLFLCSNVTGVNFWRMRQFSDKLNKLGVASVVYGDDRDTAYLSKWQHEFIEKKSIRQEVYSLMLGADVNICQYIYTPHTYALLCLMKEEMNKKIVTEIDDEVVDTPAYNPAFKDGWKPGAIGERVVLEQLKMSNAVVTSTNFLGNMYKKYNDNVVVMPNCIDFNLWKYRSKPCGKKLRIGWIGGGNHYEDLIVMQKVVPAILKKYKNVEFVFVHGCPDYLKNLDNRCKYIAGWASIDKYPEYVASHKFDIGIAPLLHNKFNMAKSNLRWLEYSSIGIPTVATSVEPYINSIKDGKTGYLALSINDWIDKLSILIEDSALRRTMGENALAEVQKNHNIDKVAKKYKKFLENIYEQR